MPLLFSVQLPQFFFPLMPCWDAQPTQVHFTTSSSSAPRADLTAVSLPVGVNSPARKGQPVLWAHTLVFTKLELNIEAFGLLLFLKNEASCFLKHCYGIYKLAPKAFGPALFPRAGGRGSLPPPAWPLLPPSPPAPSAAAAVGSPSVSVSLGNPSVSLGTPGYLLSEPPAL